MKPDRFISGFKLTQTRLTQIITLQNSNIVNADELTKYQGIIIKNLNSYLLSGKASAGIICLSTGSDSAFSTVGAI